MGLFKGLAEESTTDYRICFETDGGVLWVHHSLDEAAKDYYDRLEN